VERKTTETNIITSRDNECRLAMTRIGSIFRGTYPDTARDLAQKLAIGEGQRGHQKTSVFFASGTERAGYKYAAFQRPWRIRIG